MANEAAPLFRPGRDITGLATAAITGKTFVAVSATRGNDGLIKIAPAAAAGAVFGVASADIASGSIGAVLRGGVVPVTASAAISAGDEVEVAANGEAATLSAGKAVGIAVEDGTASNPVFVALYGA